MNNYVFGELQNTDSRKYFFKFFEGLTTLINNVLITNIP